MREQREQRSEEDGSNATASKRIRIRLLPHDDMEPRFCTDALVNFSGDDFLITISQAIPPAYRSPEEVPDEIEAKVLFRGVFNARKWAEAVDSMAEQVANLRKAGAIPERSRNVGIEDDQ